MIAFERTYKCRPWHRWENVIICHRRHVAIRGYVFGWSGRLTTRLAVNIYPVETRRIRYYVGQVERYPRDWHDD